MAKLFRIAGLPWWSFKLVSTSCLIDAPSMENLFQAIQSLQERLLEDGIPSIVIGGVAVAAWGEPRVTRLNSYFNLLGSQTNTSINTTWF